MYSSKQGVVCVWCVLADSFWLVEGRERDGARGRDALGPHRAPPSLLLASSPAHTLARTRPALCVCSSRAPLEPFHTLPLTFATLLACAHTLHPRTRLFGPCWWGGAACAACCASRRRLKRERTPNNEAKKGYMPPSPVLLLCLHARAPVARACGPNKQKCKNHTLPTAPPRHTLFAVLAAQAPPATAHTHTHTHTHTHARTHAHTRRPTSLFLLCSATRRRRLPSRLID